MIEVVRPLDPDLKEVQFCLRAKLMNRTLPPSMGSR